MRTYSSDRDSLVNIKYKTGIHQQGKDLCRYEGRLSLASIIHRFPELKLAG